MGKKKRSSKKQKNRRESVNSSASRSPELDRFRNAIKGVPRPEEADLSANPVAFNKAREAVRSGLPKDFESRTAKQRRDLIDEFREEVAGLPDYYGGEATQDAITSILDLYDPDVAGVRQAMQDLQEGADAPEKQLREKLTPAFDEALRDLEGDERRERIDSLRQMLDGLPDFYRAHLVNLGHTILDTHDAQVGVRGAVILGPSRVPESALSPSNPSPQGLVGPSGPKGTKEYQHISNRGIQQFVRIEGKLYTPVYMAVVADSSTGQLQPKYKDFTQTDEGVVEIHTGGSGTTDSTLWVSFGRPLRQVKWLEVYGYKQGASPLIRSFLIPADVANAISAGTVTEHGTGGMAVDINVDKHYERNQIGIRSPRSMELLRQYALPGSLRTYYAGAPAQVPAAWGDARPISELDAQLDVPTSKLRDFDVFTDSQTREFVSQKNYEEQANTLSQVYEDYVTQRDTIPPTLTTAPLRWLFQSLIRFFGRSRSTTLEEFYRQHNPDPNISQERFYETLVRPWASQARIAQMVAEDYEELAADQDKLPEKPPEIVYNVDSDSRGQRREAAVALSERTRRVLGARHQFLEGLRGASGLIEKAFDPKNPNKLDGQARGVLGRLDQEIKKITADYGFRIGRLSVVRQQLPEYRKVVADQLAELREFNKQPKLPELTQVEQQLEQALLGDPSDLLASITSSSTGSVVLPASPVQVWQPQPVVQDGRQLQANVTLGGGNCFYHSLYEAINNARSDNGTQQAVRQQIADALQANARLANSHFGSGVEGQHALQRFITTTTTAGEWVPDDGPAIVADALRIRIVIHRPDGSVYFDARPNEALVGAALRTVHLRYTGAHYDSYTANPLP